MKKIKIVYFGDSITEGQYIHPPFRWTDLIDQYLEASHIDFVSYNKGISGETSRQGLMRFAKDVQDIQPDIMTLQFGLNDCNRWVSDNGFSRVSKESYRANLHEMIQRAKHFGVQHIIVSNNHRTLRKEILPGNVTLEEMRVVYNAIIEEVAHEEKVIFCNIDAAFLSIPTETYPDYLLPEPDLLHLSQKSHEHYFQTIKPYIDEKVNLCSQINPQQKEVFYA